MYLPDSRISRTPKTLKVSLWYRSMASRAVSACPQEQGPSVASSNEHLLTWNLLLCILAKVMVLALVERQNSIREPFHASPSRPHEQVNSALTWYGAPLPCQKNSHCKASERSSSSVNPKMSFLSANLSKYRSSALVSMTVKGGDAVLSTAQHQRSTPPFEPQFCGSVVHISEVRESDASAGPATSDVFPKNANCEINLHSPRTGIRPFGSKRKNQSFFCSFVIMLLLQDVLARSPNFASCIDETNR